MRGPGPYYPHPLPWGSVEWSFPASFKVLETMLKYAHTLSDAQSANRRLVRLWDVAEGRMQ